MEFTTSDLTCEMVCVPSENYQYQGTYYAHKIGSRMLILDSYKTYVRTTPIESFFLNGVSVYKPEQPEYKPEQPEHNDPAFVLGVLIAEDGLWIEDSYTLL